MSRNTMTMLLCCAVLLAAAITVYAQFSKGSGPTSVTYQSDGRFLLFQGTYQVTGKTSDGRAASYGESGLFKFDTQTGKAWLFSYLVTGKGNVRIWQPVQD